MAFISWNNSLSVGIGEIDGQHQKLVAMINDLHQAMKERKGKEKLAEILNAMVAYTGSHFATEEKYFDRFAYPQAPAHKAEHKAFVQKVGAFKKGFDEGQLTLTMDVMSFLEKWLVNHIKGSDKQYGPFLNEKGLK